MIICIFGFFCICSSLLVFGMIRLYNSRLKKTYFDTTLNELVKMIKDVKGNKVEITVSGPRHDHNS